MVTLTLRVLSRPDVEHLPKIYQSLGMDYDERVLPSIGNEVLKSIVAQFDAAELITQREVVSIRMQPFNMVLTIQSTGLITNSGRPIAASWRVQHPIGGCVHYPLNVWKSKHCTSFALQLILMHGTTGIYSGLNQSWNCLLCCSHLIISGCRSEANCTAGYACRQSLWNEELTFRVDAERAKFIVEKVCLFLN